MVTYVDERLGATSREHEQRERKFPWSLRGYRRSAVDQHIAELERELSEMDRELVELRAAATLREEVANEMRRIGEETAGVLIEAQNRRETITRAAEEEAQRLVADATAKATAITEKSQLRVRQLEEQRETAHRERDRVLENMLAASAAIVEAVHVAHQQIPAIATVEITGLDHAGEHQSLDHAGAHEIEPELPTNGVARYVG
jgi:cell division septum initiation protein DivIVA